MWKTILVWGGGFVLLVIAILAVLPFVIDVDQFRPTIVKIANENINGELKIGKLSLSLWGKVEIDIDGIELADPAGNKLVSVKESYALISFGSILAGAPKLVLKLAEPNLAVVRDAGGNINLLKLIKKSAEVAPAEPVTPTEAAKPLKVEEIPYWSVIAATGIDFELTKANFSFIDQAGGLSQKLTGFNLILKDISLIRPMTLNIWSELETKLGKDLSLKGPFKIDATIKPQFEGINFKQVGVNMVLSFDDVAIDVPGTFQKAKGKPTNIKFDITASPAEVQISSLQINFLEIVANSSLALTGLQSPPEKLNFQLKADYPGVDLGIDAQLESFAKPNAKIAINSKGIDFDRLFPPPPGGRKKLDEVTPGAASSASPVAVASPDPNAPPAPVVDVDGMLEPIRTNAFLKGMAAELSVQIAQITGFDLNIQNFEIKTSFRDLVAGLDRFGMGIFGGTLSSSARIDLKPSRPTYEFSAEVANWDLNSAAASQLKTFVNTIKGFLSFKAAGSGSSLNSDLLMKNLKLKGDFSFKDAEFATIDTIKVAREAIEKSIKKIQDKIPQLGPVALKELPNYKTRYKFVGSDFAMADGTFSAPNFKAESYEKQGIDISGITKVGLLDDTLYAQWALVDTYNQTGLYDVGVDQKVLTHSIKVDHLFSEGGKPIQFPVEVGCKLSEPCFKYESLPEYLLTVATKNLKGQANSILDAEKAKLKARLDEEKKKLEAKVAAERAKLEEEKRKQEERLKAEQAKLKAEADKKKDEAKKAAEDKAKQKGKDALKKFGI
jgi:uncharacterized protein involved in outer membrane biogenesis